MEFGEIVLDEINDIPLAWCWRDDWYAVHESSFSLLWKFALLNSVLAREIVGLVVSRRSRMRTAMAKNPDIDLRDGAIFDFDVLKGIFRLPDQKLRDAFLFEYLPNSAPRSSPTLRWCSHCLARGYHTSLFQMKLTRICPIHEITLCDACPNCRRSIPYRLQSETFARPFHCPHCEFDLAPSIRTDRPTLMQLRQNDKTRLSLMRRFYQTEDQALCRVYELAEQYKQSGMRELTFVRPRSHEIGSRYAGFITQVLRDLGVSSALRQMNLELEVVDCHQCNSHRNILADDDDPYAEFEPEALDMRACVKPPPTSVGDDKTLGALSTVYKAIRRHIWRRQVGQHRHCVECAARHLWWHVEGECMPAFCPVALAFIRWRMMWEGCGTPRYLLHHPQHDPFGILGWLLARPSPCPSHWSRPTKQWVGRQIFAGTCLASFRLLSEQSVKDFEQGQTHWSHGREAVLHDCLWALAGSDSVDAPAKVYLQYGRTAAQEVLIGRNLASHRTDLQERLKLIVR